MALALKDAELSRQEEDSLHLGKDDLKELAAPFASLANKNKTMRKHGRQIVALADSWEACLALFFWMRRVNKVARKHRPKRGGERQIRRGHTHVQEQEQPGTVMNGTVSNNGSSGQDAGEGYEFPLNGFPVDQPGAG